MTPLNRRILVELQKEKNGVLVPDGATNPNDRIVVKAVCEDAPVQVGDVIMLMPQSVLMSGPGLSENEAFVSWEAILAIL